MFQNLKAHITKQNLHKLRIDNNRYNQKFQQNNQSQDQQDILDDLDHIQIMEKQENFQQIMRRHKSNSNNQQDSQDNSNKKQQIEQLQIKGYYHSKTEPKVNYAREYHLAVQQNNILKQNHQFQINYLKQLNKRELQALKLEIDKLKIINVKLQKEDSKIKLLNKEIQNYKQIYQESQKRIDKLSEEYSAIKLENTNLIQKIIKIQKEQMLKRVKNHQLFNISYQNQNAFLKEKIQNLQKEILQKDCKIKSIQDKYKRAYKEVETLNLEILNLKNENKKSYQKLQQTCYEKIKKLESLNTQLYRKNTTLEQSLLGHLSQASRMIYNNQTTNLTTITQPVKTSERQTPKQMKPYEKNYNDNINEQSSIGIIQSQKKTRKSLMNKSSIIKEQSEEQINIRRQTLNKTYENQHNDQNKQVEKLKGKLQLANKKIVELIQWKCKVQSVNIAKIK